jgi:hypothetical protein
VPPAAEAAAATATDAGEVSARASAPTTEPERGGVQPARVAPPGSTSWTVDGMTLEAGGREIVLALFGDFDGDDKKDALAIVRPPVAERKPGTPTGDLVFISGREGSHAAAIASGPALGVQSSCAPTARLERIGPRSAFAEIGDSCPRGAGSRALIVVRLSPPMPQTAFDAIVVDPPQAPKLSVDVDAADRDNDGIDDVVLRLAIEGGAVTGAEGPRLTGKLAFFDRPAGPSRDPDEPAASLKAVAAQAVSRAGKAKDAPSVPPLVAQMRALYRAMCLEGGAPRVTKIHGGSPVSCGSSKALEEAGIAEVRAYVTQGDALRAFAAAELAQVAPATKTAARTAEIQKILAEVAPTFEVRGVRTLSVVADRPHETPEWGPLSFDDRGRLLVRNGKSVVRVDPETGDEEATEIPPWSDEVVSPDGRSRWIEAYHACEGVALRATFAPRGDGDMSEVLLPIFPRLGKSCGGGRGEAAQTVPIAWGTRGLEAIVAGHPVLIRLAPPGASPLSSFFDQEPPPGSPRARNGKVFVFPVASGVLVQGATPKWVLFKAPELEPYAELRGCTVSDDATRFACLRRGRVVVAKVH